MEYEDRYAHLTDYMYCISPLFQIMIEVHSSPLKPVEVKVFALHSVSYRIYTSWSLRIQHTLYTHSPPPFFSGKVGLAVGLTVFFLVAIVATIMCVVVACFFIPGCYAHDSRMGRRGPAYGHVNN